MWPPPNIVILPPTIPPQTGSGALFCIPCAHHGELFLLMGLCLQPDPELLEKLQHLAQNPRYITELKRHVLNGQIHVPSCSTFLVLAVLLIRVPLSPRHAERGCYYHLLTFPWFYCLHIKKRDDDQPQGLCSTSFLNILNRFFF